MKKLLIAFAAFAALFQFSACKPEGKPDSKKNVIDHLEFRSSLNYSKDVLDNFDLVYDIVSNGKSLTSGTMSGELKPIETKFMTEEGTFEVHLDFQAKSSFYNTFDTWTEYVVDIDTFIGVYSVFKDGSEQELISEQLTLKDATFSTFIEEKIPEIIKLMEDALAFDEVFSVSKDKDGNYVFWF